MGAQLYFAGPAEWYSNEFDVYGQHVAIDDVIEGLDVLMLLRVQHERHGDDKGFSKEDYEKIWQQDADHFGIKSIQQRILLYYGPGYGLSMESPQTGGCITVITLPKQEGLPCH